MIQKELHLDHHYIPTLRTILVNECGHWVMVEHEGMFNRACLDFLQHG